MINKEDIMNGIVPQLREVLLEHIINKVDNVDVGDQSGSEVQGHSRTYEDQQVFRLSNGDYITTETLPDEIMDSIIEEAMEDSFDES